MMIFNFTRIMHMKTWMKPLKKIWIHAGFVNEKTAKKIYNICIIEKLGRSESM